MSSAASSASTASLNSRTYRDTDMGESPTGSEQPSDGDAIKGGSHLHKAAHLAPHLANGAKGHISMSPAKNSKMPAFDYRSEALL